MLSVVFVGKISIIVSLAIHFCVSSDKIKEALSQKDEKKHSWGAD